MKHNPRDYSQTLNILDSLKMKIIKFLNNYILREYLSFEEKGNKITCVTLNTLIFSILYKLSVNTKRLNTAVDKKNDS